MRGAARNGGPFERLTFKPILLGFAVAEQVLIGFGHLGTRSSSLKGSVISVPVPLIRQANGSDTEFFEISFPLGDGAFNVESKLIAPEIVITT